MGASAPVLGLPAPTVATGASAPALGLPAPTVAAHVAEAAIEGAAAGESTIDGGARDSAAGQPCGSADSAGAGPAGAGTPVAGALDEPARGRTRAGSDAAERSAVSARSGRTGVANGLCAPAAFIRALGAACQFSVSSLQEAVKGSPSPDAWRPDDFVAAIRLLGVDAVFYRSGFDAQRVGVDDLPSQGRRRIYLELAADGSHVDAVARVKSARGGGGRRLADARARSQRSVRTEWSHGGRGGRGHLERGTSTRCTGRRPPRRGSAGTTRAWRPTGPQLERQSLVDVLKHLLPRAVGACRATGARAGARRGSGGRSTGGSGPR